MSLAKLRERFLCGMSHAACTVNVVTTDGPAGRRGITVSAMSSVSVDAQRPTLLICVHHQSPAAAAILGNGVFCVNVLREDQSHISDSFAGRAPSSGGDKFSCTTWKTLTTGAPRVADPLVAFDCRVLSSERIGTHHVIIGSVEDVFITRAGSPLIYANRAYGTARPLVHRPAVEDESYAGREEPLAIGCHQAFGPSVLPELLSRIAAGQPAARPQLRAALPGVLPRSHTGHALMTHRRLRKFNTRTTYPEQSIDNDLCQTVVARGSIVFVRGQVGQDLDTSGNVCIGDPAGQAEKAMGNVAQLLAEAGARLAHICKLTIYLTDPRHREPVYRTIGRHLKGVYPVSTGVVVCALARPEWLVEVDVTAVIPEGEAER